MNQNKKDDLLALLDNNSVVGKELLNKLLNLNKKAEKFKAGTYVVLSAKNAYVWQFLCKDLYATVEEVTYDEDKEQLYYKFSIDCILNGQEVVSKVAFYEDDIESIKKVQKLKQNILNS